ncbi:MAG: ABC transporter substrate-binding protein [Bacillati bacterium ANGP1]|uniref:ABC transporter substrate-binding protein n=1 Tax=Candidatus Segetimicrobium genomatis TaxID=2569760 RepID=A0A537JIH5_9BACT|nr:MAG: ABC transporter substrate-binding protein [Terrabacteria group bacterium ANGP1]
MFRRVMWLALATILPAVASIGYLHNSQAAGPIKIGLDVPSSGSDAFEGTHIARGVQLALEEQNKEGGIGGRQLETALGDNQCDPSVGVNSARYLVNVAQADVMIGSACSSVTLAVMPIIQQAQVPELDVTATSPKITQQSGVGGNIWKFRLNLNDEMMDAVFAQKVLAKDVKSLSILAVNTDYGRDAAGIFQRNLPGIKVLSTDYYTQGQPDFRALLTKVKALNPEGLLLISDYPDAAQIINQGHEVGLTGVKLFGRGSVATNDLLKLLPDPSWAQGAKEVNFWVPGPTARSLANRYQARFNEPLNRDAGMGYFGAETLIAAMKDIKGDITRKSIRDALERVNVTISGLGHVQFDDHHQAHYPMYILQIWNGMVRILETIPT